MKYLALLTLLAVTFAHGNRGREGSHENGEKGYMKFGGKLPFFKNLTSAQIKTFFQIEGNETLTKGERQSELDEWASSLSADQKATYEQFNTNRTQYIKDIKANITQVISQLPAKLEQLQTIYDDQSLTRRQEMDQIKSFYDTLYSESPQLTSAVEFFSHLRFGGNKLRGFGSSGGSFNRRDAKF